ncbi:hypothetical protein QTN25_006605 [Entamoeba marina]
MADPSLQSSVLENLHENDEMDVQPVKRKVLTNKKNTKKKPKKQSSSQSNTSPSNDIQEQLSDNLNNHNDTKQLITENTNNDLKKIETVVNDDNVIHDSIQKDEVNTQHEDNSPNEKPKRKVLNAKKSKSEKIIKPKDSDEQSTPPKCHKVDDLNAEEEIGATNDIELKETQQIEEEPNLTVVEDGNDDEQTDDICQTKPKRKTLGGPRKQLKGKNRKKSKKSSENLNVLVDSNDPSFLSHQTTQDTQEHQLVEKTIDHISELPIEQPFNSNPTTELDIVKTDKNEINLTDVVDEVNDDEKDDVEPVNTKRKALGAPRKQLKPKKSKKPKSKVEDVVVNEQPNEVNKQEEDEEVSPLNNNKGDEINLTDVDLVKEESVEKDDVEPVNTKRKELGAPRKQLKPKKSKKPKSKVEDVIINEQPNETQHEEDKEVSLLNNDEKDDVKDIIKEEKPTTKRKALGGVKKHKPKKITKEETKEESETKIEEVKKKEVTTKSSDIKETENNEDTKEDKKEKKTGRKTLGNKKGSRKGKGKKKTNKDVVEVEQFEPFGENKYIKYSSADDCNRDGLRRARKKPVGLSFSQNVKGTLTEADLMEDDHYCGLSFHGNENISFFAIYDGYGGIAAARESRRLFPIVLDECIKNGFEGRELLEKAFEEVDRRLDKEEFMYIGCTCTLLYIWQEESELFVQTANVGDSTCFVKKLNDISPEIITLSQDHKVTSPCEQLRIRSSGIEMVEGQSRINGVGVVRSLANHFVKGLNLGMIGTPYLSPVVQLESGDEIAVCSDGIWDVCKPEHAFELIDSVPFQNSSNELIRHAMGVMECRDNVSAIVIKIL